MNPTHRCITDESRFSDWLLTPQPMPCGCIEYSGLRLCVVGNIMHLLHHHQATWPLKRIQEWIDSIDSSEVAHAQSRRFLSCYQDVDVY